MIAELEETFSDTEFANSGRSSLHWMQEKAMLSLHTIDTTEGVVADPITLHKYLYANANPVSMGDPSGHFAGAYGAYFTDNDSGDNLMDDIEDSSDDTYALAASVGNGNTSNSIIDGITSGMEENGELARVPGVYICECWLSSGFWSHESDHAYVLVDGVGYGFYAKNPNGVGVLYTDGIVKSSDASTYPVVPTGTTSSTQYAWAAPVYVWTSSGKDPNAVHDAIKSAAQNAVGKTSTYMALGRNCFWWADTTIQNNGGVYNWPDGGSTIVSQ